MLDSPEKLVEVVPDRPTCWCHHSSQRATLKSKSKSSSGGRAESRHQCYQRRAIAMAMAVAPHGGNRRSKRRVRAGQRRCAHDVAQKSRDGSWDSNDESGYNVRARECWYSSHSVRWRSHQVGDSRFRRLQLGRLSGYGVRLRRVSGVEKIDLSAWDELDIPHC